MIGGGQDSGRYGRAYFEQTPLHQGGIVADDLSVVSARDGAAGRAGPLTSSSTRRGVQPSPKLGDWG